MIEGGKVSRFVGLIWRLNWPSFLFFGFTRLLFWRRAIDALQSMTQRGDKEFYKLLRYFISYRVKTLKLTVTSNLGTFGGGEEAGAFGESCVLLKILVTPLTNIFGTLKNPSPGFLLTLLCRVKSEDCVIVQRWNLIRFFQTKRALDYKLARGDVFNSTMIFALPSLLRCLSSSSSSSSSFLDCNKCLSASWVICKD